MDIQTKLTNISLFSGAGGLDLAAKWTGRIKTVCYVEKDRYAQGVLISRIRDGGLDDGPIWDDVSSFEGEPWRGIDIVSGGFPCQDVSVAGKRAGLEVGTRTGLFYELIRVCSEVVPSFILLENVGGLLIYPGAHRVFGELADLGYDAGWKIISSSSTGGPSPRERIWIIAYYRGEIRTAPPTLLENSGKKTCGSKAAERGANWFLNDLGPLRQLSPSQLQAISGCDQPPLLRMDYAMAQGLDEIKHRLRCTGNGVDPYQALPAWEEIIRLSEMK